MSIPFIYPPGADMTEDIQLCLGYITPIRLDAEPYEATVDVEDYSYHLIFGRQINGHFLCVPNWHIGAEISASYQDILWNTESIRKSGASDSVALMLAQCLYELDSYIDEDPLPDDYVARVCALIQGGRTRGA